MEIHQEGIRFTPCKLYKRGELNEELLQVMMTNVRQPEQNWGDLKAFIGAMNTGERKVKEMVEKFGVDVFRRGTEDLMDYAEHQAQEILRSIPNGVSRIHRRRSDTERNFAAWRSHSGLRATADSTLPAPTRSLPPRSTCRQAARITR